MLAVRALLPPNEAMAGTLRTIPHGSTRRIAIFHPFITTLSQPALRTNMNTLLPDASSFEARTPFKVVVAYDEVAMGVRAKHVLDSIQLTLEPECNFVVNLWKFSMFQVTELADSAVLHAVAAHLIILALREDNGVPQETRTWIETWLPHRASAVGALVLLFEPAKNSSPAVSPTQFYLLDVGQRGNLDVFALRDESNWDSLKWQCAQCNQFHAARQPKRPIFGPPADRLGKPVPNRAPLQVTISTPGATRTIQVT